MAHTHTHTIMEQSPVELRRKSCPSVEKVSLRVDLWGLSCFVKANQLSAGVHRLSGSGKVAASCLNCGFSARLTGLHGSTVLYFRSSLNRI